MMGTVWRKFASQAEFDAWHSQAKTALGMPIIGVRASDGVPQPDKQQTTDYTGLTYQTMEVDGNGDPIIPETPPLDAVIADPSIIDYASVLVREDMMTEAELAEMSAMYPPWVAGETVASDDLRAYDGMLWKAVQGHTTQADWTPEIAHSLWTRTAPPSVTPIWVQPLGAHDAWPLGSVVTHNGAVYESLVDSNVWAPGTDPALWALVQDEQVDPPPLDATWVDTGATVTGQAGQLYYVSVPIDALGLVPGQAIKLGDAETTYTSTWGGTDNLMQITPYVAAATGAKVWKWA